MRQVRCAPLGGGLARLLAARIAIVLALAGFAGAASAAIFVGDGLSDVKPADMVKVANPQPVQLLFQFETKDAPNGRATKALIQQVTDTVKASGLFSNVSDQPTANGALLSIVIDNVISPQEMADAEGKGVATGLTLGLAASNVTDHYNCTIDYVSGPSATKITRKAEHTIITQVGLIGSAPPNAVKAKDQKDAVYTMVRQIISNPLNAIAADPAFQGAPATAPPASAPPTAAPSAAPATNAVTAPTNAATVPTNTAQP